jgi:hypothetical protein
MTLFDYIAARSPTQHANGFYTSATEPPGTRIDFEDLSNPVLATDAARQALSGTVDPFGIWRWDHQGTPTDAAGQPITMLVAWYVNA